MSKHTPGPWKTDHEEHDAPHQDIKIKAEDRTVATVWIDDAPVHDYNAEQRANAHLIASAPQMAEMLRRLDATRQSVPWAWVEIDNELERMKELPDEEKQVATDG